MNLIFIWWKRNPRSWKCFESLKRCFYDRLCEKGDANKGKSILRLNHQQEERKFFIRNRIFRAEMGRIWQKKWEYSFLKHFLRRECNFHLFSTFSSVWKCFEKTTYLFTFWKGLLLKIHLFVQYRKMSKICALCIIKLSIFIE